MITQLVEIGYVTISKAKWSHIHFASCLKNQFVQMIITDDKLVNR